MIDELINLVFVAPCEEQMYEVGANFWPEFSKFSENWRPVIFGEFYAYSANGFWVHTEQYFLVYNVPSSATTIRLFIPSNQRNPILSQFFAQVFKTVNQNSGGGQTLLIEKLLSNERASKGACLKVRF